MDACLFNALDVIVENYGILVDFTLEAWETACWAIVFPLLEYLISNRPLLQFMPIEDLVGNAELLRRILEHYKYRVDNFTTDEEIKPLISGPVRRYLTFGQLKSLVSEALNELTKDKNIGNLKLPVYINLLRSAAHQYVKDLERIRGKDSQELPDTKLKELELDIEAVKGFFR
jgi:hypothetical protein